MKTGISADITTLFQILGSFAGVIFLLWLFGRIAEWLLK